MKTEMVVVESRWKKYLLRCAELDNADETMKETEMDGITTDLTLSPADPISVKSSALGLLSLHTALFASSFSLSWP